MIITIANQGPSAGASIVASNLAVLRARSGRKVCLIDTDLKKRFACGWSIERSAAGIRPRIPGRNIGGRGLVQELDKLLPHFNDILIETEARDCADNRSALIAARLVVVPVQADQVDLGTQYKLIACLNAARMFNPGLRVLFVLVAGRTDPTSDELAAVRAYVSRVMSASLASTTLHAPGSHEYGEGRCVCDAETCDPDMAAEMHALYQEVYAQ